MRRDLTFAAVGLYVFLLGTYWFAGGPGEFWALFYYWIEKAFAALGFYLLYANSRSRFVRRVALYCLSLCAFMLAYFLYCFRYGHDTFLTVGMFLVYSFVILVLISNRE